MYKEGHAGLSLLLFSLFLLLFKFLGVEMSYVIATCVLMVLLSSLPDIDLELRKKYRTEIKHRGPTHTILAGILFGIIFGALLGYSHGVLDWLMGFFSGFGGITSHLLGDAFTYESFEPFWPFSNRKVAFRKFRSSSKTVNRTMLILGGVAFVAPFIIFP